MPQRQHAKVNPEPTFTLPQNILPAEVKQTITARLVNEIELSQLLLDRFLSSISGGRIGLAPTYDSQQRLISIAFSSKTQVLIVKFPKNAQVPRGRELLVTNILSNPSLVKYAFHMDKLSTSLYCDLSLRINEAVDILSLVPQGRHLLLAKVVALGDQPKVNKEDVYQLFRKEESAKLERSVVALQAWAAYQASLVERDPQPSTINTNIFSSEELNFLARTIRDAEKLRALQPLIMKNEIDDKVVFTKGGLAVQSSRFSTRLKQPGSNQVLQVEMTQDSGKKSTFKGRLKDLRGRAAQLSVTGASRAQRVSIKTIGRDDPTSAEALRTNIILRAIQNIDTFTSLPFVRDLWFPETTGKLLGHLFPKVVPIAFDSRPLNSSQRTAVDAILARKSSSRLVLIHGPPGTGKTTVIAAAVVSINAFGDKERGVWLVAQSNVAVKNIAEKLADVGFFDFRILVSKDFHFDWHEHLYEKIEENIIRSDDFAQKTTLAERQLAGSRVILCTLSMLSNDRIAPYAWTVPPSLFIFDEASQIEVGNYVPMLHRYQKVTRKLVFIGDDKQLPPYGQSDIKDLRSVFELPHLRSRALFLDTQYRMPVPIGNFISRNIYGNRLKTQHLITAKTCCRFIDVSNGQEGSQGNSWVNEKQAQVVVSLARKLQAKGGRQFRIITPYDAQRSLIESSLKNAKLNWEDKVFNVDSFQGNEEDYIIISLVRTKRIGFLKELRRVNVALTRCKKGMIICTDRAFITGVASNSLVAALAKSLGGDAWVHWNAVIQPGFVPFPGAR